MLLLSKLAGSSLKVSVSTRFWPISSLLLLMLDVSVAVGLTVSIGTGVIVAPMPDLVPEVQAPSATAIVANPAARLFVALKVAW